MRIKQILIPMLRTIILDLNFNQVRRMKEKIRNKIFYPNHCIRLLSRKLAFYKRLKVVVMNLNAKNFKRAYLI
jgi:hypothetical protein